MVEVKLPGLHIVYAAGNNVKVIILALIKLWAHLYCLFHNVLMLFKSDILVAVTAEKIVQR